MAKSLKQLREDARACQDCPLWANATQTVFGAGDPHARVMLVGEQPGDEEDKKGLPFVGPAGRLLDRALEAAGVDREHLYVTNAVKHFKWQLRGKRRLHKTPAQREIDACHQWLEREIETVRPQVLVALGATAARAVIEGGGFRAAGEGLETDQQGAKPAIASRRLAHRSRRRVRRARSASRRSANRRSAAAARARSRRYGSPSTRRLRARSLPGRGS